METITPGVVTIRVLPGEIPDNFIANGLIDYLTDHVYLVGLPAKIAYSENEFKGYQVALLKIGQNGDTAKYRMGYSIYTEDYDEIVLCRRGKVLSSLPERLFLSAFPINGNPPWHMPTQESGNRSPKEPASVERSREGLWNRIESIRNNRFEIEYGE